ncbi:hypothetical protein KY284_032529 [Solanum tuberosum]|nr:hypothetical protein KY284_032529 [Solanum tuberosum]
MTVKNGRHGMGYGYLLLRVFNHFGIPLGKGIKGTIKHAFSQITLIECERVKGRAGNNVKSQVSDLLEQQEQLKHELEKINVTLASRNAKIVKLNAQLLKAQDEGPGAGELSALKAQNESRTVEVTDLTK